ncbi:MAG: OmpH family outer membrane protein [bacterium]|jgi:outer membrane protein|nr:OmpH family outer membrane protein [bacterium]
MMISSHKKAVLTATLLLFILSLGFSVASAQQRNAAAAAAPLKIAFIDLNEIFDNSPKFKAVFGDLKKLYSESKTSLDQTGKELQEKFSEFNLQKEFMSEDAAKQRRNQLLKDREQFMQMTQAEEVEFKEEQNKKLQPLLEELQKVVEKIAKDEGYAFVFRRKYIVFGDEKFNITKKVIDQLGK